MNHAQNTRSMFCAFYVCKQLENREEFLYSILAELHCNVVILSGEFPKSMVKRNPVHNFTFTDTHL
jgi:hypothetical protein